jgi:hypothetical protein
VTDRFATLRMGHGDPATAAVVAAALRPDDTASMTTRVEGADVVTTVERETTGGLAATVDDYVVNVAVAARVAAAARGDEADEQVDGRGHELGDEHEGADAAAGRGADVDAGGATTRERREADGHDTETHDT